MNRVILAFIVTPLCSKGQFDLFKERYRVLDAITAYPAAGGAPPPEGCDSARELG